jgi:acylphosphatase
MRNIEIFINGRVQGVGFRYQTKQIAKEFDIKGFVRNMTDGSVYIQAAGTNDKIEEFINWCRRGPRFAHVDSVQVLEISQQEYIDFSIK